MNSFERKFAYIYMRASIFLSYIVCFFLSIVFRLYSFFFKKPKKDLGIFLHSSINSDGYNRRFAMFFKFFEDDNISYSLFSHVDENETHILSNNNYRKQHYLLYKKIAWIRALQIPKAVFYKNIILQRSLFPLYPSYEKPIFEKILRKQNANIILDIWDPIHLWKPKLTFSSFKYVDKISVNVFELKEVYSQYKNKEDIYIWPISVNPELYEKKEVYETNSIVKLFYTGSPGNIKEYLLPILPVLEKTHHKTPLELHVLSSIKLKSETITIYNYKWDSKTLKNLIANCDYGIYPNFNNQKFFTVAGKVLDYMTTGLPIIGANYGLPKKINIEKSIFTLNSLEDWNNRFEEIVSSKAKLRKQKAEYARKFVLKELSIENGFNSILEFLKPK